ncbi:hypothetical protein SZ55_5154 [Pseudomonas sp. FeS53a]|nr:hypothetical protein SZ55_5154 [Pseudomonas sp. FeS53a]
MTRDRSGRPPPFCRGRAAGSRAPCPVAFRVFSTAPPWSPACCPAGQAVDRLFHSRQVDGTPSSYPRHRRIRRMR